MKKRFLLILLIFAISLLSLAKETFSVVSGTPHDLSMGGGSMWTYDTTQVCVFCHTPHSGQQQQAIYPLWNKTHPTTFSMYSSPTFEMAPHAIGSPSTLCMSCHDGTMAMNVAVNSPGGSIPLSPFGTDKTKLGEIYFPGATAGYPGPNISGNYGSTSVNNLADDHPISFTYDPAADQQGNGFPDIADGKIAAEYPLYGSGHDQFECSTCHDVHDTATYATKGVSEVFFLRKSNAESNMCRDCHVKKY